MSRTLPRNAMYTKNGKDRAIKQTRGIVQINPASVQQIGHTFRDKGEKEKKGIGVRANRRKYLP